MLKRLILHLGMGKTGSKTIQEFLGRNRLVLLRDRCIAVGPNDIDPCPQKNLEDTDRLLRSIDGIKRRLRDARAENLIWSLEGFATRQFLSDPARLHAVLSQFEPQAIRAVMYLRRQDHFAISAYLQWNVVNKSYHGPVQSFEQRFPCVYGEPAGTPLDQTNLNYYDLVQPWAAAVGRDNLRVRPLEDGQLAGGDLLQDFRDAVDLPARDYDCAVPRQNQTFHRELTDLMGMYGSVFEGPVGNAELTFFFRSFGHEAFFDQPFFTKFELPPATRIQILQECAAINARVAREFLGRADGVLFREPWPSPDDPYRPYSGLTDEKLVPILLYILKKQHMQISYLFAERRRDKERYSLARVRTLFDQKIVPRLDRLGLLRLFGR